MKNFFTKTFGLLILSATLIFSGCGDSSAENQNLTEKNPAEIQGKFPTFEASDLNGEKISSDIFTRKKITVMNIWGTFCPPCIGEMPELGTWEKNFPDDAQLIGLVCDIETSDDAQTIAEAKNILKQADANFLNIVPNKELLSYLQKIDAVPTTIFIDSQGNILGEAIIGADVKSYKKRLQELLK